MNNHLIIGICFLIIILFFVCRPKGEKPATPVITQGNGDYEVILIAVKDEFKISLIKALRMLMKADLASSKLIVENLPYTLVKNTDLDYAENIKQYVEQSGAVIEIRKTEEKV